MIYEQLDSKVYIRLDVVVKNMSQYYNKVYLAKIWLSGYSKVGT